MKLATALCVFVTLILVYVLLFVEPGAHIPPYSGPPARPAQRTAQPCPPQPVLPGDAETYGFQRGDAYVPEAYRAELQRRCAAQREAKAGGAR